jgi:hypothetical protein
MASLRIFFAFLLLQAGALGAWTDPAANYGEHLAVVEMTQNVSEITGTAISPLLGVSSVGAWRYYRTPEEHRSRLPWFCHPAAWITGFVVLGLCLFKDVFGTAAPSLVKKPLDFVELFEDKLSAIVASSAFVPIIAAELARHVFTEHPETSASAVASFQYASMGFPTVLLSFGATALTVVFAIMGFAVVWMASHVINVLVALSPFTMVDAGLKLVKLGLLTVVTAGAFLSPWIGLGICLIVLVVASLVAPWAFRFSFFGTVFAFDTLASRLLGRKAETNFSRPKCFTARTFRVLPARTYGRVMRSATGELVFRYRPWMILPTRTVPLPTDVALAKGILCPVLLHRIAPDDCRTRDTLLLLPRYCAVEAKVAAELGIEDLRDGAVVGGFKAIRAWISEMLGFGRTVRPGNLLGA